MKKWRLLCVSLFVCTLAIAKPLPTSKLVGLWENTARGIILEMALDNNQKIIVQHIYQVAAQNTLCARAPTLEENFRYLFDELRLISVSNTQLRLREPTAPYDLIYAKLKTLPAACKQVRIRHDALVNFDFLSQTYAQYYPDLPLRLKQNPHLPQNITWATLSKQLRKQLKPNSSPDELYNVMSELLLSLQDGHVHLYFGSDEQNSQDILSDPTDRADLKAFRAPLEKAFGAAFGTETYEKKLNDAIIQFHHKIDHEKLSDVHHALTDSVLGKHPIITWGVLKNNPSTGYLRLTQELHLQTDPDLPDTVQLKRFMKYLTHALDDFKSKPIQSLIIDVRVNYGGDDAVGRILTSMLCDRKRELNHVRYRSGNKWVSQYDGFTDPSMRHPLIDPKHPLPITVLISPLTFSAGETLAGMLTTLPYVTTVGSPTYGTFSEMLTRQLPNGWVFTIPMGKYTFSKGRDYTGRGIQPQQGQPEPKASRAEEPLRM